MIDYVEAPNAPKEPMGFSYGKPRLFLAGGITGCHDWQSDLVTMIHDLQLEVLNPRRKEFPANDPDAAAEQIQWKYCMLRYADAIAFWFPAEALCPIALFELGTWSSRCESGHSYASPRLFVGVHPEYKRRRDIEIQMSLVAHQVEIVYDLPSLARQIREWPVWVDGEVRHRPMPTPRITTLFKEADGSKECGTDG